MVRLGVFSSPRFSFDVTPALRAALRFFGSQAVLEIEPARLWLRRRGSSHRHRKGEAIYSHPTVCSSTISHRLSVAEDRQRGCMRFWTIEAYRVVLIAHQ